MKLISTYQLFDIIINIINIPDNSSYIDKQSRFNYIINLYPDITYEIIAKLIIINDKTYKYILNYKGKYDLNKSHLKSLNFLLKYNIIFINYKIMEHLSIKDRCNKKLILDCLNYNCDNYKVIDYIYIDLKNNIDFIIECYKVNNLIYDLLSIEYKKYIDIYKANDLYKNKYLSYKKKYLLLKK
jgi:hypothetical protein